MNGALRQECEWDVPCVCGTWVRNALAARKTRDMLVEFSSYALAETVEGSLDGGHVRADASGGSCDDQKVRLECSDE